MIIFEAFKSFSKDIKEMPSEDMVREKAYLLWEAAGCPEGDGVEFWVRAERELISE